MVVCPSIAYYRSKFWALFLGLTYYCKYVVGICSLLEAPEIWTKMGGMTPRHPKTTQTTRAAKPTKPARTTRTDEKDENDK